MTCLPVVNSPSMDTIRECLLEVGERGSADSNFDELSFINEDLKVIFATFCEDLCAHGGLEAVSLS